MIRCQQAEVHLFEIGMLPSANQLQDQTLNPHIACPKKKQITEYNTWITSKEQICCLTRPVSWRSFYRCHQGELRFY